jgi:hypothetical protein
MLVSAPSPDPISQRHGSFFPHVIPCHQVERMQGISKQSTCLWSNPIIADLVESKIQRSQSAVCWNPDSHCIKTYLRCPIWFWTITWKPRREVFFTIIVHIIYMKCTTINCRLSMHEIRHHKYPYYFTNKDACSKWISHESRILVDLWKELFETSTNSVSSSKFIVKTSHETVKSNLFTGRVALIHVKYPIINTPS